jgi:hypothetical protein
MQKRVKRNTGKAADKMFAVFSIVSPKRPPFSLITAKLCSRRLKWQKSSCKCKANCPKLTWKVCQGLRKPPKNRFPTEKGKSLGKESSKAKLLRSTIATFWGNPRKTRTIQYCRLFSLRSKNQTCLSEEDAILS